MTLGYTVLKKVVFCDVTLAMWDVCLVGNEVKIVEAVNQKLFVNTKLYFFSHTIANSEEAPKKVANRVSHQIKNL